MIVIASAAKQSRGGAPHVGLLRRGACHRAGHFGPDPLAPRNDDAVNQPNFIPCDDDAKNRSRGALRRPSHADHEANNEASLVDSPPAMKGRRSAERRNHPLAAQHQQALPLIGARARQRTHTTLPRLRGRKGGGRSPSGASPRRSRTRPNVSTQPRPRFTPASGCGRYPHHDWRLSEAPRAPILLPAGSMPGPPGSGAHILRPQEPHPLRLPKVPSRKASLDRAGCHRM
jgi:hypothetical protein